MELVITFDDNGRARAVYDDALAPVFSALSDARPRVRRVSHVEPALLSSGWCADMAPVDGPILGPFALRSEALAAERAWLTEHLGL